MSAVIAFILSPIGRWLAAGLVCAVAFLGWGEKRYWDGRAAYKAKIERQIKDAVDKGNAGRERALRELDAGRLPDAWQRD